jgi:hypothetical protein
MVTLFQMETAVRTEMKVEANQDSFDDAKVRRSSRWPESFLGLTVSRPD